MDEGSAHPRLILPESKQENIVGPKLEQEPLVGHEFARALDSTIKQKVLSEKQSPEKISL